MTAGGAEGRGSLKRITRVWTGVTRQCANGNEDAKGKMEAGGAAALTECGKGGDNRGGWAKGGGSFTPTHENDPLTELGKSKEEKA